MMTATRPPCRESGRASSKAASKRDPLPRLSKSKFKVCLGKAARDLLGDFLIRSEHTAVLRDLLNNFVDVEDEGLKGVARLVDEDLELSPVALGVPTRSELEAPSGLTRARLFHPLWCFIT